MVSPHAHCHIGLSYTSGQAYGFFDRATFTSLRVCTAVFTAEIAMAAALPPSGISMHGAAEVEDPKPGSSSAILLKLSDSIVQDLKKASHAKDRLHFVAGSTPVSLGEFQVNFVIY